MLGPAAHLVRPSRASLIPFVILAGLVLALPGRAAFGADSVEQLLASAERLEKAGRHAEALPIYERVVKAAPAWSTSYTRRGYCLLALSRPTEARRDFQHALRLLPGSPFPTTGRGEARLALGDAAGARADADAALATLPRHVPALVLRGMARRALGDLAGAIADLRQAVRLEPARVELLRTIDAFEEEQRRGGAESLDDPPPAAPKAPPAQTPPAQTPPPTKPPTTAVAPPKPPAAPPVVVKPPAVANAPGALLVDVPDAVRMPAPDDPLDPAAEPSGDVLWNPAGSASAGPASEEAVIDVPGLIRWEAFDPVAYAAAVTAAKEGLRILQGPMTAEQHQRYEKKWLPYYDLPTPEIAAYFNRLMPVLERFLAARAGVTVAGQGLARTLVEAGIYERAGQSEGLAEALARARFQRQALDAYRGALAAAAAEMEALGNPPNPYEVRRRRRKAYDEALRAVLPQGPLWWVLSRVEVSSSPCPTSTSTAREREHVDGFMAAVSRRLTDPAGKPVQPEWVRWSLPRVVPYAGGKAEAAPGTPAFSARIRLDLGGAWRARLDPDLSEGAASLYRPVSDAWIAASLGDSASLGMSAGPIWVTCGMQEGHGLYGPVDPRVGKTTSWVGAASATIELVRLARAKPRTEKEALGERMGMAMLAALRGGPTMEIEPGEDWRRGDWLYFGKGRYDLEVAIAAHAGACTVVYHYHYDLKDASEEERDRVEAEGERVERVAQAQAEAFVKRWKAKAAVQAARVEVEDPKSGTKKPRDDPPPASAKSPEQLAAEQRRADAIEFQRASVAWFEENLRRDREEYERTTDEGRRKELLLRMLSSDANAHAARDQLATLETGQWVRTRTAWDAWNHERMLERSREEAARLQEPDRIDAAIDQQIALLPVDERQNMRDEVGRMLRADPSSWREPARLREIHAEVGRRVRQRWEREGENQRLRATVARCLELGAEGVKLGAGIALLGAGGYGMAQAEAGAVAAWATETLLGAAYGGTTGYVEGGVLEASRQSLQWAGVLGFTASEALEGYAETGTVEGAGDRAGKAFLLAKGLEFAARWGLKKWLGPKPPVDDEVAALDRALAEGEQLVETSARSEWALAEALSRGAPAETVEALTRDATHAAAAIQALWGAKILLKQRGVSIAAAAAGERVGQLVAASLDDVTERLRAMGYSEADLLRFRPFRNASSAGTFGMDMDLGLIEEAGMVITKGNRRVSLATLHTDAQRAMNEAWHARTGFSAQESMINMTTSQHHESFAAAMLRNDIPWGSLTRRDLERAADVLRTKMSEIHLPPMQRRLEQCRTLAKEMRTKMLPYLEHRLAQARQAGDRQLLERLEAARRTWGELYEQLEQIAGKQSDPGRMGERLRAFEGRTGGRTVEEVANDLANGWDLMAAALPR